MHPPDLLRVDRSFSCLTLGVACKSCNPLFKSVAEQAHISLVDDVDSLWSLLLQITRRPISEVAEARVRHSPLRVL
jgi:hypothetical protein